MKIDRLPPICDCEQCQTEACEVEARPFVAYLGETAFFFLLCAVVLGTIFYFGAAFEAPITP